MAYTPPARGQLNWDTDLNNSLDALHTASSDAGVAGYVNDSASSTRAALSAAYAKVVAATTLTGAGITAAASAAGVGGRVYLIPGQTYVISSAISLDRVGLFSDGSAVISVPSSLGSGTAAITITAPTEDDYTSITVRGFRMIGPGTRSLGVKTANCDGIAVTGYAKAYFEDLRVTLFDSGFVYNNQVGHIYQNRVLAANNYYGVYLKLNNNDYVFSQCMINGNTMANFGCPADQGWGALVVADSHIGYAPYGFYQEATPANQGINRVFLESVSLRDARFEQMGNAAIWTDAQQDASNYSLAGTISMKNPGFSWGDTATYKISSRVRTHAIQFSQTSRIIEIAAGSYPFTSGDGGVSKAIHVKQSGHSALILRHSGAVATDVLTDAGNPNVFAYSQPVEGVLSTNADPVNAQLNMGSTSGYLQPGSSTSRRFGGDAAYLYADFNNDFRFRNSGSGYALIGRIATDRMVMPRFQTNESGPTVTGGSGAPSATEPNGSIYLRSDGAAGTTIYMRVAGAWVANA